MLKKSKNEKGVYIAPWEKALDSVLTPLEEFIHRQTTSGILLMICTVVALIIANSHFHEAYQHLLHTEIKLGFGDKLFGLSVHHWINEALMALFFFVMGLELKRELLVGELAEIRKALLPIFAAIGGMVVPAGVYLLFNTEGHTIKGWGVPMATDIAFAVGALSLLGARIPKTLLTFLIALAIVDDLGAVLVIALFYTSDLNVTALFGAAAFVFALVSLNLMGVRRTLVYVVFGIGLWMCMLSSGVHATIAGIVLAFTIPIRPKYNPEKFISHVSELVRKMGRALQDGADIIHNDKLRAKVSSLGTGVALVQAPAQRLEHQLHLPVAYIIIPVFALANAGVPMGNIEITALMQDQVTLGVFMGLFIGKLIGITVPTWIAWKMGVSPLPEGLNFNHIIGVGMLGGIGFTMSIFIADLGFAGYTEDLLKAKTGILLASLVSGVSGIMWLIFFTKRPSETTKPEAHH
ncbi:Na+/H+ antiporter NhaA [Oleiphilus messinensis]|uniref:Na(+)/H(+) antiporter NhaA n=1 Tax=Oleiphilus messinensis TaxID=141451 RepID=A0A1Y0IBM3_9GAMM|nr:Na+/H+ antiporter NhaA [Oleiphilus messinensis]ARU56865.1 Na+/H+ antiporter NhaA [Oleiphilus messinensis]